MIIKRKLLSLGNSMSVTIPKSILKEKGLLHKEFVFIKVLDSDEAHKLECILNEF